LHILVVTGTFHPEAGGPPTYLYHLLPELVARGHTLSVVTYGDAGLSHTYPYPVTRISRQQSIPRRLLAMTREVLRQGRTADLIFVSDYGLPAALANLWLRKPIVLKVVSDFAWEFSVRHGWVPRETTLDGFQEGRFGLRVELLRIVQRAYVGMSHRVIVPSHYIESVVTGWNIAPGKVRVVYNAPQLGDYGTLPDKDSLRGELGFEGRTVVCVARLTAWKGVDDLISALGAVRLNVPDANLWVLGEGPERGRLDLLAETLGLTEHVHFTGQLPREAVARYLKAADAFALYSTYEGLPHVVLEAMAAGTPVVASAAGGTPETVKDGQSGLLVPVGDDMSLVAALTHVLNDIALAKRLVAGGQAELSRFSMETMVAQTDGLLREVASGPKVG
jgi:glycosyltransferase involved in cell wall biosynthesis